MYLFWGMAAILIQSPLLYLTHALTKASNYRKVNIFSPASLNKNTFKGGKERIIPTTFGNVTVTKLTEQNKGLRNTDKWGIFPNSVFIDRRTLSDIKNPQNDQDKVAMMFESNINAAKVCLLKNKAVWNKNFPKPSQDCSIELTMCQTKQWDVTDLKRM